MKARKRFLPILLLLAVVAVGLAVVLVSVPASAQQPATVQQLGMTWDVVGSGGTTMSSPSFTLLSTTGQAVAGPASNETHTLHSGYWQELLWKILSPLILK